MGLSWPQGIYMRSSGSLVVEASQSKSITWPYTVGGRMDFMFLNKWPFCLQGIHNCSCNCKLGCEHAWHVSGVVFVLERDKINKWTSHAHLSCLNLPLQSTESRWEMEIKVERLGWNLRRLLPCKWLKGSRTWIDAEWNTIRVLLLHYELVELVCKKKYCSP